MKIDTSTIGMDSARSYTSITNAAIQTETSVENADLSKEGTQKSFREWMDSQMDQAAIGKNKGVTTVDEKKAMESIKFQCMQYLLYWIFGGEKKPDLQSEIQARQGAVSNFSTMMQTTTTTMTQSVSYEEHEETSFQAKGCVKTSDGRTLDFDLELTMSRSFEAYYETSVTKTETSMMDPLVINLDTDMATLSDQKFEFDIDTNGILDSISNLNKGSGYLALDLNEDGRINNGNELFGTKSGDGFKDLSKYDQDENGFIDENDEIFNKLLIWSKDQVGNDILYHLKEAGVGAIYLEKVQSEFSLNSLKDNVTNGAIRKTGVFLYENGNVGTMQQMDLAI